MERRMFQTALHGCFIWNESPVAAWCQTRRSNNHTGEMFGHQAAGPKTTAAVSKDSDIQGTTLNIDERRQAKCNCARVP
jgi:hypothetical protein